MTVAPKRDPLAFGSIDEVADALRRAGHRVTTPTRTVLEALFASGEPVSAEQIADGLDGQLPTLELTSVYRNLERLEQLGVVSHVHVTHGAGLYALARDGDREYLVCERCGRLTSVEPAELDPIRDAISDQFGYHVRFSHFPLHGHCADCAKTLEREPS